MQTMLSPRWLISFTYSINQIVHLYSQIIQIRRNQFINYIILFPKYFYRTSSLNMLTRPLLSSIKAVLDFTFAQWLQKLSPITIIIIQSYVSYLKFRIEIPPIQDQYQITKASSSINYILLTIDVNFKVPSNVKQKMKKKLNSQLTNLKLNQTIKDYMYFLVSFSYRLNNLNNFNFSIVNFTSAQLNKQIYNNRIEIEGLTKKMGFLSNKLGVLIEFCDCFPAPILLRYRTQEHKTSKTGGIFSIFLIVIMIVVFYNSWIQVFHKNDIKSDEQIIREMDPSPVEINNSNFIIAVGFLSVSIHDKTKKYFDVKFSHQVRNHGAVLISEEINMIPCENRHFSQFKGQLEGIYQKQGLKNFVCLPDNFKLNLTGKWSSQIFSYLRIRVKKCSSNCVTDQQIQDYYNNFGPFFIDYYFINKLINPTLRDPISVYFEDKNYNMINDQIGIDTNLYVSEYEINTDQSILPIQNINSTSGIFIDRTEKEQFIRPAKYGDYANFYFRKSNQKIKIQRVYRKVDDLFSYLGGLFGILAAFFGVVLVQYNKCCFQLEMTDKVFKSENQKQKITQLRQAIHCVNGIANQTAKIELQQTNFNFLTFIKYNVSRFIFFVCPSLNWRQMKKLNEKLEQTQNQMNVDVLLKKISFYQRAFSCLFDPNQLTLLMLQQKISIEELKEQRAIMDIEDQKYITNFSKQASPADNKVANQVQNEQINKSSAQDEFMLHIYSIIKTVKEKSENDEISKKILHGIREDLRKQYQRYSQTSKQKLCPRRYSNFSLFQPSMKQIKVNIIPGNKQLANPIKTRFLAPPTQFPLKIETCKNDKSLKYFNSSSQFDSQTQSRLGSL